MSIFTTLFACAPKNAAPSEAAGQQPIAGNQNVVPAAAAAPANQQAAVAARPPAGLGNLVGATVLLYDKNLFDPATTQTTVDAFGPLAVGPRPYFPIDTWNNFIAFLQGYQSIDNLHLLFHGAQGQLALNDPAAIGGQDGRYCGALVHPSGASGWVGFGGVAPVVTQEVVLDNCQTAANPQQTVNLLDLFQVPKISGFNRAHALKPQPVTLTGKETANDIRAITKIDDLWLFKAAPPIPDQLGPNGLAGQVGKFTILYEWFPWRDDDYGSPGLDPNDRNVRTSYPPRSDAEERALTRSAAMNMTELLDPSGIISENLIHVTITP